MADNDIPSGWARFSTGLSAAARRIWTIVGPWFWPGLVVVLVLAFIAFEVRPFASKPDPAAEDVATAWNQSIARLGILPVFPPEEDLYVGDLWAVVADAEDTPLLGKAVRIAHIDLRDLMKPPARDPLFADTIDLKPNETFRRQDRKEVAQTNTDDGRIVLSLAAFPGITITHATRKTGLISGTLGGLGAGQNERQFEEIRIPTAETYGVPASAAFLRLDDWCDAKETKVYCDDAFARRILAYAVSSKVLATRDGRYIARLQLRLVTRVFLTREIKHRRLELDARGGIARTSSIQPGDIDAQTTLPDGKPRPPETNAPPDQTARPGGTPTGGLLAADISSFRSQGLTIELNEVFQRPVAFGYRAVTIELTPAKPTGDAPP